MKMEVCDMKGLYAEECGAENFCRVLDEIVPEWNK
jgi:hypothetical protein